MLLFPAGAALPLAFAKDEDADEACFAERAQSVTAASTRRSVSSFDIRELLVKFVVDLEPVNDSELSVLTTSMAKTVSCLAKRLFMTVCMKNTGETVRSEHARRRSGVISTENFEFVFVLLA